MLIGALNWGVDAHKNDDDAERWRHTHLPKPSAVWWSCARDLLYPRRVDIKWHSPPLLTRIAGRDRLNRAELVHEIARACQKHRLALDRVMDALRHPASAARLAYCLLRWAAPRMGSKSEEVALSLIVLRCTAPPLLERRVCDVCFRFAFPGKRRCRFHTRSKVVDTASAAQATRVARDVAAALPEIRTGASALSKRSSRDVIMAGAMCSLPLGWPADWHDDVRSALTSSPHVSREVRGEPRLTSPRALLRELRRAIDPDHWSALDWGETIDLVEPWYVLAHSVGPGGPPKGPRSRSNDRVVKIKELLARGYSVAVIAQRLGLTSANVYQLMHRHGVTAGVKAFRH